MKTFARLTQKLKRDLITGLIVLIPFGTALIVVKFIFDLLNTFGPALKNHTGIPIPGLGVIVMFLLLGVVGMVTRNVFGKKILAYFDRIISRTPVIGAVYRAAKQLMMTFTRKDVESYKKVVLVPYPHPGLLAIAFVTGELEDSQGRKYYTVFIPTAPNPTSGMMEIVPREKTVPTVWSVEDAFKLIISGGMVSPKDKFNK